MRLHPKLTDEEVEFIFYDLRQRGKTCREIALMFRTDSGTVMWRSANEASRIAERLMEVKVMGDPDVMADIERRKVASSLTGSLQNLRHVAYVLARTDAACDVIESSA